MKIHGGFLFGASNGNGKECAVSIRAIDACEAIESRGRRFLALRVGTHNYIVPGTMEEFERLCEAPEGGVRRTG